MFGIFRKKKRNRPRSLLLKYVEGNSLLHRLDPRTTLFMLLLFSAVAIVIPDLVPTVLLFLFIAVIAAYCRLLREWWRSLAKALPFFAVVVILDTLFSKTVYGHIYFAADFWILHPEMSDGSIIYGVTMGFRFLSLIGASALFLMSTKFEDFVKGLRKLKIPYTFSLSLGLALRSVTYLTADVKNIIDAQRSRGLELDKKDIIRNYQKFLALFIPMVICLLLRSKNISEAMQVKAVRHTKYPTMYRGLKLRGIDYGFMGLIIALSAVLVYL